LYKDPSRRKYNREGIKMNLNISNLVDHYVYYSINKLPITSFISYLKPDAIVIDVGTNIGYTTLLLSKACSQGKIIGIEPSKELFKILEDHVNLNAFTNVKCLNVGLGEKNKTVKLYKVNDSNTGMNRILDTNDSTLSSENITIKTLDEVAAEEHLDKVDAIKIDVEGYELKVLQGAMSVLKKHHPVLLVEIDPENLKEQQACPDDIFKLLFDLGYSIFDVKTMKSIELGQNYNGAHFDAICFKKEI
jgi:FkbM family methyltransferase